MRITRIMAIVLIGILLILGACAKSAPTTPTPTPAPGPNEVWIIGRAFTPSIITVPVGTKVTWINRPGEEDGHTVTSDTGLFNGTLSSGGSFSYTFTQRGAFSYYCQNRDEMQGTVYVE